MNGALLRAPAGSPRRAAALGAAALLATFVVGIGIVHDTARVLCRARQVQHRRDLARAGAAAEAALLAEFQSERAVAGVPTSVARSRNTWFVAAHLTDGASHWFAAESLPGAAPAVLGRRARTPEAGPLPLDAAALAAAPRADGSPLFRRDPGIALQQFAAGTDADDFVLLDRHEQAPSPSLPDLLVVPGNLWIAPGRNPLELALREDLVVVVTGNLYLLRSLHVHGRGRLLLVATPAQGAMPFADADFNGRWSAGETVLGGDRFTGPIEGAGSCYFAGVAGELRMPIECQAGLAVAGPLHLAAGGRVDGPLVLAGGLVRARPGEELIATGAFGFATERERVPGFTTSGAPRPGRLRYLGQDPPAELALAARADETLYLSSPAR